LDNANANHEVAECCDKLAKEKLALQDDACRLLKVDGGRNA
jgi:hypothetical protein